MGVGRAHGIPGEAWDPEEWGACTRRGSRAGPGDRPQAPVGGQHSGTVTTFCIGQFVHKGQHSAKTWGALLPCPWRRPLP